MKTDNFMIIIMTILMTTRTELLSLIFDATVIDSEGMMMPFVVHLVLIWVSVCQILSISMINPWTYY